MGARAREKIRQHFSQATMVEDTLRWYGLHLGDRAAQPGQVSHLPALPESAAKH